MATNFFSLSLEIRDEIYSYVWADVWSVRVRKDANTAVRALLPWGGSYHVFSSVTGSKGRYPVWIYTNQAFFKEAIAYLQRVSVFELSISKPHWDADDTIELFDPQTLWPCSASQIRTLEIEHKYQVEETWVNEPVKEENKEKKKYQTDLPASFFLSNDAPKVPKAQITSLAFLRKFFTTMSSTTSSLRNLTIKIKPGLATEYRNFQVTSVRADQDQDILKLRDAVSPILHQLRRFEIYIGTSQLVGWKFSKRNWIRDRNPIRDAAIAAIQTWADEQVEQANALGMGGLVMGETTRITEPGWNDAWVLGWKVVWVEGQSEDGEDDEAA
ncbi:hypothetical protein FB567DRAFT_596599 [Paraphoma chrysanthemicola]|uniref:Uncharacterized protein n=1 Tax=Paraphoma chrysanthemicola TaxID=798071 RepID=A0A8K0QX59_9PLEO|nr:hypothetical protein FB567DRAFT_596599 [Paraphoma chrysanthemicola]